MALALLPALAGMASQGQGQQNQAIDQVDPQKNGQDKQQMQDQQSGFQIQQQPDANQGGGQAAGILSMLSKLGQGQQNGAMQPSQGNGQMPVGNMPPTGQPSPIQNPFLQRQTTGSQPVSSLATAANGPANGSDFGSFLMQLFGTTN